MIKKDKNKKKMSAEKKFYLSVSILILSVFTSGFIFLKSNKDANEFIKNIGSKTSVDSRFNFSKEQLEELDKLFNSDNFTENVFQKYGFEIALINPNGPQNSSVVIPSDKKFENALNSELEKSISFKPISEKDILVSKDNSNEAVKIYLQNIQNKLKKYNVNFEEDFAYSIQALLEKNQTDPINKHIRILQGVSGDLLSIETPSNWKSFHLAFINHQIKKIAVLEVLSEIQGDPVKAMIAIKELENINGEELTLMEALAEKSKGITL